jgi:hypothetical protein
MAMLTGEPAAETTAQPQPVLSSNMIVAPGATGATLEPVRPQTAEAPGIEGEETVWEGRYSFKNFLGRGLLGTALTLAWLVLAVNTWGLGHTNWAVWSIVLGFCLLAFWVGLGFKYLRAYRGHQYRLTTRRLLVTTGFFRHRVDQLELLRIKDLYLQQSMIGEWLGIGNVVIIYSEETLPKAYLLGIDEARRVMDLVWHHMRVEQSEKTTRINPV